MNAEQDPFASAVRDAKRLLRLARVGALATLDGGAPLTTLVGVASDWDGSPLFLMSELSRHTRNVAENPRASVLLTSEGGRGDPLNHPRVTLVGRVLRHDDPTALGRYTRRNPKAKLYAGFADFAVRKLHVESVHFNGGFGRADALKPSDILTPAKGIASLIEAEDTLLAEVDALDESQLSRWAEGIETGRRVWRAAGLDPEGLDLSAGGATARLDFSSPAPDPAAWRERLRERLRD